MCVCADICIFIYKYLSIISYHVTFDAFFSKR